MTEGRSAGQLHRVHSNRIPSLMLFTAVAAAPLPFGSTDLTTIAFWCIVLGMATTFASPRHLRSSQCALFGAAGIIVAAYGFVLHEQLAERPWLATPNPIWAEVSEALGTPLAPSVSIARHQPLFALGPPLANMLALICAFVVCADRTRARQLLAVMAWSGAAYAVYGIATFLLDPTKILWREKQAYLDVLTSTFVNRNSAAVYLGTCAIVWLLLVSERIRRNVPIRPIQWTGVLSWLLRAAPRETAISSSMMLVCLAAMFMTGSRAGVLLSLAMGVVSFVVYFSRDLTRRWSVVTTLIVGAVVALGLLQIMGGGVGGRLNLIGFADEGRWETYRATLRMIADHPWFGTGLGTFAWSFPAYRSGNVSGVWDLAHSTPLELASDLGLPLAGLVGFGWIIALAILVRGVRVRRRDTIIPLSALAVALLGLCHSMIDFSLQIPGYSIPVFALTGAGLAQSFASRPEA